MRIKSVRIKNFRSFEDETIPLASYNCFLGANGSGKSTVLSALNVFFKDTFHSGQDQTFLSREDFHCKNTATPIEITVTFDDLSEDAKRDLAHYVRQDELSVTAKAVFNEETKQAEVIQHGLRKGMEGFVAFFAAQSLGAKKPELKTIYEGIQQQFNDLPTPGTIAQMKDALNEYEAQHPENCVLIESPDEFYGFAQGSKLAPYVLWVYVPAVKDASSEQVESKDSALGKLVALTVRSSVNFAEVLETIKTQAQQQYKTMLDDNRSHLSSLSEKLMARLRTWSHPTARISLDWKNDPDKVFKVTEPLIESILGEGVFDGEVKRFGHGLQRSYLIALLQELAELNMAQAPTLILGCEEPELYQHPPQAQYLASVFQKLSAGNSQILLSTHTPYFVSGKDFEEVRYVRCDHSTNKSTVQYVKASEIGLEVATARGETLPPIDGVTAKIHQALQPHISEMFFTPVLILVEGPEDVAHIATYLNLMGRWDDYRKYGCHMVHVDSKSKLFTPIAIAKKLSIPCFTVFDSDGDIFKKSQAPNTAGQTDPNGIGEMHRKDNVTILNLCGGDSSVPFPTSHIIGERHAVWTENIGATVKSDIGDANYTPAKEKTCLAFGQEGNLKKSDLFVADLLTRLWNDGHQSTHLKQVCEKILSFAESVHNPT